MGDAKKGLKKLRRGAEKSAGLMFGGSAQAAHDVARDVVDAKKEAKAAEKKQREGIARQEQQEKLQLAESEDEIARRRLLKRAGGRQSLIASR